MPNNRNTDLNECASPDAFLDALRLATDYCHESAAELDAAWQDKNAGKPWRIIAREVERCIERVRRQL